MPAVVPGGLDGCFDGFLEPQGSLLQRKTRLMYIINYCKMAATLELRALRDEGDVRSGRAELLPADRVGVLVS